ncbi:hypothetical protein [Ktedonobacter sp. SOSP1-52]|uniref:hypothetical protein n=1 Tax=Ktedonobacter sp. SOSP1-52 TaxID=2778366 RepID=UPI00191608A4|nr:hypothetical protein [Ktedonobacter sp. SOSP1-52]
MNPQDVERLSENDKQASPTSAQFSRPERPGFGDHPEIHRIIGGLHQESQREPLFLPFNLQDIDETSQMRSGFPGNVDTRAQHWGQFLTFEGQTCSLGGSSHEIRNELQAS